MERALLHGLVYERNGFGQKFLRGPRVRRLEGGAQLLDTRAKFPAVAAIDLAPLLILAHALLCGFVIRHLFSLTPSKLAYKCFGAHGEEFPPARKGKSIGSSRNSVKERSRARGDSSSLKVTPAAALALINFVDTPRAVL